MYEYNKIPHICGISFITLLHVLRTTKGIFFNPFTVIPCLSAVQSKKDCKIVGLPSRDDTKNREYICVCCVAGVRYSPLSICLIYITVIPFPIISYLYARILWLHYETGFIFHIFSLKDNYSPTHSLAFNILAFHLVQWTFLFIFKYIIKYRNKLWKTVSTIHWSIKPANIFY